MKKSLMILFLSLSILLPTSAFCEYQTEKQKQEDFKKIEENAKEIFDLFIKNWKIEANKVYDNAYEWAKEKGLINSTYKAKNWAIEAGIISPGICSNIVEDLTQKEIISNKAFCRNFAKSNFKEVTEDVEFVILDSSQKGNIVFILFDDYLMTAEPICYERDNYIVAMRKLFNDPSLIELACENPCFSYKLNEALRAFFMEMQDLH